MRTWRKLSKAVAVAAAAGGLALAGTSAAAGEVPVQQKAAALACGSNVLLDGLRAVAITERGRDEVYITDGNGNKIWPVTDNVVSMAAGQRVEVDKCVSPHASLSLWEEDTLDRDDLIGGISLQGDVTRNYRFCCLGGGRYRIGAVR